MSRHVWETKKFEPVTVGMAFDALTKSRKGGLTYNGACMFVGYYVERVHQAGRGGRDILQLGVFWASCVRSKHRYAQGHNHENYRAAGERLIAAMAGCIGLEGAPPQIVWDYLTEHPETELMEELERV